jgi:hypothetical protein
VTPPQSNQKVTVSAKSLEDVLEALQGVAAAIAANTAAITPNGGGGDGSTTPPPRKPTVVQARSILDYLVVSQLLSRIGFVGRVVSASRDENFIRLRGVPTEIDGIPVTVTQVRVTPAGGGQSEIAQLDPPGTVPGERTFTLSVITETQPIVRIELLTDGGVPVALGPRLAASPGSVVDVRRRRTR